MLKWSKSTLWSKDYSALAYCFLLDLLHKGVIDVINRVEDWEEYYYGSWDGEGQEQDPGFGEEISKFKIT